jgi:hypothetical protein
MARQFTVILVADSGFRHCRVKANDRRQAEDMARDAHQQRNPKESVPTCAGVVSGWPETWVGE